MSRENKNSAYQFKYTVNDGENQDGELIRAKFIEALKIQNLNPDLSQYVIIVPQGLSFTDSKNKDELPTIFFEPLSNDDLKKIYRALPTKNICLATKNIQENKLAAISIAGLLQQRTDASRMDIKEAKKNDVESTWIKLHEFCVWYSTHQSDAETALPAAFRPGALYGVNGTLTESQLIPFTKTDAEFIDAFKSGLEDAKKYAEMTDSFLKQMKLATRIQLEINENLSENEKISAVENLENEIKSGSVGIDSKIDRIKRLIDYLAKKKAIINTLKELKTASENLEEIKNRLNTQLTGLENKAVLYAMAEEQEKALTRWKKLLDPNISNVNIQFYTIFSDDTGLTKGGRAKEPLSKANELISLGKNIEALQRTIENAFTSEVNNLADSIETIFTSLQKILHDENTSSLAVIDKHKAQLEIALNKLEILSPHTADEQQYRNRQANITQELAKRIEELKRIETTIENLTPKITKIQAASRALHPHLEYKHERLDPLLREFSDIKSTTPVNKQLKRLGSFSTKYNLDDEAKEIENTYKKGIGGLLQKCTDPKNISPAGNTINITISTGKISLTDFLKGGVLPQLEGLSILDKETADIIKNVIDPTQKLIALSVHEIDTLDQLQQFKTEFHQNIESYKAAFKALALQDNIKELFDPLFKKMMDKLNDALLLLETKSQDAIKAAQKQLTLFQNFIIAFSELRNEETDKLVNDAAQKILDAQIHLEEETINELNTNEENERNTLIQQMLTELLKNMRLTVERLTSKENPNSNFDINEEITRFNIHYANLVALLEKLDDTNLSETAAQITKPMIEALAKLQANKNTLAFEMLAKVEEISCAVAILSSLNESSEKTIKKREITSLTAVKTSLSTALASYEAIFLFLNPLDGAQPLSEEFSSLKIEFNTAHEHARTLLAATETTLKILAIEKQFSGLKGALNTHKDAPWFTESSDENTKSYQTELETLSSEFSKYIPSPQSPSGKQRDLSELATDEWTQKKDLLARLAALQTEVAAYISDLNQLQSEIEALDPVTLINKAVCGDHADITSLEDYTDEALTEIYAMPEDTRVKADEKLAALQEYCALENIEAIAKDILIERITAAQEKSFTHVFGLFPSDNEEANKNSMLETLNDQNQGKNAPDLNTLRTNLLETSENIESLFKKRIATEIVGNQKTLIDAYTNSPERETALEKLRDAKITPPAIRHYATLILSEFSLDSLTAKTLEQLKPTFDTLELLNAANSEERETLEIAVLQQMVKDKQAEIIAEIVADVKVHNGRAEVSLSEAQVKSCLAGSIILAEPEDTIEKLHGQLNTLAALDVTTLKTQIKTLAQTAENTKLDDDITRAQTNFKAAMLAEINKHRERTVIVGLINESGNLTDKAKDLLPKCLTETAGSAPSAAKKMALITKINALNSKTVAANLLREFCKKEREATRNKLFELVGEKSKDFVNDKYLPNRLLENFRLMSENNIPALLIQLKALQSDSDNDYLSLKKYAYEALERHATEIRTQLCFKLNESLQSPLDVLKDHALLMRLMRDIADIETSIYDGEALSFDALKKLVEKNISFLANPQTATDKLATAAHNLVLDILVQNALIDKQIKNNDTENFLEAINVSPAFSALFEPGTSPNLQAFRDTLSSFPKMTQLYEEALIIYKQMDLIATLETLPPHFKTKKIVGKADHCRALSHLDPLIESPSDEERKAILARLDKKHALQEAQFQLLREHFCDGITDFSKAELEALQKEYKREKNDSLPPIIAALLSLPNKKPAVLINKHEDDDASALALSETSSETSDDGEVNPDVTSFIDFIEAQLELKNKALYQAVSKKLQKEYGLHTQETVLSEAVSALTYSTAEYQPGPAKKLHRVLALLDDKNEDRKRLELMVLISTLIEALKRKKDSLGPQAKDDLNTLLTKASSITQTITTLDELNKLKIQLWNFYKPLYNIREFGGQSAFDDGFFSETQLSEINEDINKYKNEISASGDGYIFTIALTTNKDNEYTASWRKESEDENKAISTTITTHTHTQTTAENGTIRYWHTRSEKPLPWVVECRLVAEKSLLKRKAEDTLLKKEIFAHTGKLTDMLGSDHVLVKLLNHRGPLSDDQRKEILLHIQTIPKDLPNMSAIINRLMDCIDKQAKSTPERITLYLTGAKDRKSVYTAMEQHFEAGYMQLDYEGKRYTKGNFKAAFAAPPLASPLQQRKGISTQSENRETNKP